jgi:hypothetical protein
MNQRIDLLRVMLPPFHMSDAPHPHPRNPARGCYGVSNPVSSAATASGVAGDLAVGEARDAPIGAQQRAGAVAVERGAGAVVGPAVHLDDEAVLRPAEVRPCGRALDRPAQTSRMEV